MIEHNLVLIKKRWGMTNTAMGNLIGASEDQMYYYSSMKNKTRPSVPVMIKLQDYTGINVKDLWEMALTPNQIPQSPLPQPAENPAPAAQIHSDLEARVKSLEERFTIYFKDQQKGSPENLET